MSFNPENLLDLSADAPMSTREALLPEGDYEGSIESVKGRQTTSEKGTYNWLDFQVKVDGGHLTTSGQTVSEITGRPSTLLRYSMSIDLNDAGGLSAEQGKNVQLGRLREAVGQNAKGPWTPRNLIGARARFALKHRFDKNDPSIVYQEIRSANKLG
jgi:hypothetical protein